LHTNSEASFAFLTKEGEMYLTGEMLQRTHHRGRVLLLMLSSLLNKVRHLIRSVARMFLGIAAASS
jgi:hypothetical protein